MIESLFDGSSWTDLAFSQIQPVAKECGARFVAAILVGGIFIPSIRASMLARKKPVRPRSYTKKDMADGRASAGLAIKMRPTGVSVNSVKALRGCIWLGKGMCVARAVLRDYWAPARNLKEKC